MPIPISEMMSRWQELSKCFRRVDRQLSGVDGVDLVGYTSGFDNEIQRYALDIVASGQAQAYELDMY